MLCCFALLVQNSLLTPELRFWCCCSMAKRLGAQLQILTVQLGEGKDCKVAEVLVRAPTPDPVEVRGM